MNWNKLQSLEQLNSIIQESHKYPVVIFKHSIRCSISSMVLNRFERSHETSTENDKNERFYYLDLIRHREISNAIEDKLGVIHQSPQAIVVHKGKSIFDESHIGINYNEIEEKLKHVLSVDEE